MSEVKKEKALSDLTKKELYEKCVNNKELANDFEKFKSQIEEYKTQLEVRANYIQQLQMERDQLENNQNNIMPSQIDKYKIVQALCSNIRTLPVGLEI